MNRNHATTPRRPTLRAPQWLAPMLALMLACLPVHTPAALTDLATTPLQAAMPVVKPNLLFILDNSGSMGWDFMPDWAEQGSDALVRNSGYNATYYNPAIEYDPPLRPDGTSFPSMSSATTSGWTRVPFDGFGVQTARGTGNNVFTNQSSGSTQNLVGRAYYHVFIPGEYCTDRDLKSCVAGTAPTTAHPYPALLRWCNPSRPTQCRATRIEPGQGGGPNYSQVRAPGVSGVPGTNRRVDIVSGNNRYAYPGLDTKAPKRKCAGDVCSYAEEMTNFANWWAYYRTRMQMAKSAASFAFKDIDSRFRLGFMTINDTDNTVNFLNIKDVDANPTGQKYQWLTLLQGAQPGGSTPLRTALSTAGRYFANKAGRVHGVTTTDPMQYACQRNFTMLSTDGYWNERETPGGLEANVPVGDQDGKSSVARPYLDGTRTANSLSDVALYFYSTDLRTSGNATGSLGTDVASNDVDDQRQFMYTSTIGLGASGYMQYRSDYPTATTGDYADIKAGRAVSTGVCEWQLTSGACTWPTPESNGPSTIDDLWHAAVNGRGTYYSASNPLELKAGLESFIDEVARKSGVMVTPPTIANPNLSKNDNLAFGASFTAGEWFGDVVAFRIDPETGEETGETVWSQSERIKSSGNAQTTPRLDNRSPADRKIYTYEPAVGRANPMIAFKWASMGSETRRHFRITAIGALAQLCISGTASSVGCLPSSDRIDTDTPGDGTGAGGANLVEYLRGDRTNEGASIDDHYRPRLHLLGDVVDARPLYVKKPLFNYIDSGYGAFREAKANRTGVLYVAANDGMLHAFRGEDGHELWAYVPSLVLPNLYKLADKDYANRHNFYVNATPHQGDIYAGGQWRTILVGGLGRGGRGYYALDITDPDQPRALWEFTHDRSKTTGYTADEDMGYSYGTPVITKIADGTWVVIVASGYNNVSPGSGRGIVWVLDAYTGQVISKIDTGAGSATAVQAGCSSTPCPSGLTHIKGYADNGDRNNMALRLYGGDLLGNVWRIDISQLTRTQNVYSVLNLATLVGPKGDRQPVTAAPELGKVQGMPVVFVGTGAYLGTSDIGTIAHQTMYALRDASGANGVASASLGNPRGTPCTEAVKKACFMPIAMKEDADGKRHTSKDLSYAMDFTSMHGWFTDLPRAGERLTAEPELQRGILAFTTGVPSKAGACKIGAVGFLNYLDYATGLPVAGMDDTGFILDPDSPVPQGVTVFSTSDGDTVVETQGGKREIPRKAGKGMRRLSWRELITD